MDQIKALILSIVLCLTSPVSAVCLHDVEPIQKGEPAICDGFLFSPDAEHQAETFRSNAEYYHELSDALDEKTKLQADENQVLEKRLKLYMDATQSLSQDVAKRDTTETLIRFSYLALGILGTTLVVRNIRP